MRVMVTTKTGNIGVAPTTEAGARSKLGVARAGQ